MKTPGSAQGSLRSADVTSNVPTLLRVSAALSWRFLVVIGAIGVIVWIAGYLSVVVFPVAIAMLLAALLAPVVDRLHRWRVPRALATAIALVGGLAVLGGVLTFVIDEFSNGLPALLTQINQSIGTISNWLENGPLHLSQKQLQTVLSKFVSSIGANTDALTSGALTTAATVGEVLAGMLLTLFTTIFFLHDGAAIWTFVIKAVPENIRDRVNVAGRRGFSSLVSYVRATAEVAIVDAVGIGVGIAIVGVPLAAPLGALVFLAAFVPIVGAVIAGAVAVLVALVAKGLLAALIVLLIVIAVMQLESHILQPWLLGRAVRLHPLAVVLSIATGLAVGGIPGGLLAVPLLAVLNSGVRSLLHDPSMDPDDVHALHRSEAVPLPDQPNLEPAVQPDNVKADTDSDESDDASDEK